MYIGAYTTHSHIRIHRTPRTDFPAHTNTRFLTFYDFMLINLLWKVCIQSSEVYPLRVCVWVSMYFSYHFILLGSFFSFGFVLFYFFFIVVSHWTRFFHWIWFTQILCIAAARAKWGAYALHTKEAYMGRLNMTLLISTDFNRRKKKHENILTLSHFRMNI